MAIGDDAILGGMSLVNGAAANSAQQMDDYENTGRDYIANGPTHWKPGVKVPLTQGGTNATTAAGARTNLDVLASAMTASARPGDGHKYEYSWDGSFMYFWVDGVNVFHLP